MAPLDLERPRGDLPDPKLHAKVCISILAQPGAEAVEVFG